MFVFWKIELYSRKANSDYEWESIPTVLTSYYDPLLNVSIGDGKDTFSFKVVNTNGDYDNFFRVGDKVKIYRAYNTTTIDSSNLLMDGIIKALPVESDGTKDILRVEGANYTEMLMNAITFVSADGLTIPEFLAQALTVVNNFNTNFSIGWSGTNPSLKRDNVTAFPVVTERWNYKSILKLLEKYSSDKFTNDGNYYFYINNANELVWTPRSSLSVATFNDSTDEYQKLSIKKDISGVVNFVIAKGQLSPGGRIISVKVDDPASRAKNGFKPKVIVSEANKVNELLQRDGVNTNSNNRFPSDFSSPFVTTWVSSITGSTITCNSEDEYDDAIVSEVKFHLKAEARAYIDERKDGKKMIDITFNPNKDWGMGDVINVTIPRAEKSNNPMRIASVQYSTTSDTFSLEEDEGTVGST